MTAQALELGQPNRVECLLRRSAPQTELPPTVTGESREDRLGIGVESHDVDEVEPVVRILPGGRQLQRLQDPALNHSGADHRNFQVVPVEFHTRGWSRNHGFARRGAPERLDLDAKPVALADVQIVTRIAVGARFVQA